MCPKHFPHDVVVVVGIVLVLICGIPDKRERSDLWPIEFFERVDDELSFINGFGARHGVGDDACEVNPFAFPTSRHRNLGARPQHLALLMVALDHSQQAFLAYMICNELEVLDASRALRSDDVVDYNTGASREARDSERRKKDLNASN